MTRGGRLSVRILVAVSCGLFASIPVAPGRAAAVPASWPTYHGDNLRSGLDSSDPNYVTVSKTWTDALDAAMYASPVVVGSTVVAATENNSVYAFGTDGHQIWHVNLGASVAGSTLPCGNVSPVGITSTPVADPATNQVFVVGLVGTPSLHYVLAALDLATGGTVWSTTLAPAGFDPSVENQRGALTLSGGSVYVPFGGRAGDCGSYYGWLMSFPESGSGSVVSAQLPMPAGHTGAGFWQPAGGSVDSVGDLYFTSGNSNTCGTTCSTYDYSESVIKYSPALAILGEFHPSNWQSLNSSDTDVGSTGPLLLPGGNIFQVGKSGVGYLVAESALSGNTTTSLYSAQVCPNQTSDASYGGDAFDGSHIYVPCTNGVVALAYDQATPKFTFLWQATGVYDPPIVAGGVVWVDAGGYLYGLDPSSGAATFQLALGASSTHFGTPAALSDQLFVPASGNLVGFAASAHGWVGEPGLARDAAADGGQVYAIGTDAQPGGYGIWNWTAGGWTRLAGGAVNITVDSSGLPWVVNDSEQIWHWTGSAWVREPGAAHYVAAGADGSVYVLGLGSVPGGYAIWKWSGSAWSPVAGGLVDLAVGGDGSVWGANDVHTPYHMMSGGSWAAVAGGANDVTASGYNAAWVAGTTAAPGGDTVWSWNGTAWSRLPGGVVDLAYDPSSGAIWGVNDSGAIYRYS